MSKGINYEVLYERARETTHRAYQELLDIAIHLDDRKALQERIWDLANELLRNK